MKNEVTHHHDTETETITREASNQAQQKMESTSSFLNLARAAANTKSDTKQRARSDSNTPTAFKKTWLDDIDSYEREHFHLPLQAFAKKVPGMQLLMTCFGLSCTGESLVCLFGLLGWTISVEACTTGIWLVPVVEVLNGLIKWQFGRPRPGWNDFRVEVRSTSHEYSFPSSHSMLSWSLSSFFANYWWKHVGSSTVGNVPYPVYMLYGMATCVAVSRVFDGAHYPHDVLVGGLLGRAIGLFHFTTVYPYVHNQMLDLSNFHCIGCGLAVAAGMLLSTLLCYRIVSARFGSPPKKWKLLAKVKNDDLQPHYVPLFDYVGMCGVFAGLSIAEPIYNRELLAVLPVTFVASVLRLLIGLTLLVGAWFAVRGIEKSMATSTWLKLLLRFCRYAQVPPIILILAPPLFKFIGV